MRDGADLIILDFLMGDREFLAAAQKLKMDRRTDSIPIIVCTAAAQAVPEQQGYLTEQGVLVVLKPFKVDQLEEAIRAWRSGHHRARTSRRATRPPAEGGAPRRGPAAAPSARPAGSP